MPSGATRGAPRPIRRRRRGLRRPARGDVGRPRRHRPRPRAQLRRQRPERRRAGDRARRRSGAGAIELDPSARHGHGLGRRREPRRPAARVRARRAVRAGHAGHPLRHRRRRHRQRHPRQEPPRRRHVRPARAGRWTLLLADGSVVDDRPRPRARSCSGRRSAGWASPGSSCGRRSSMLPIETSRCTVDTERVADLDALLERDGDRRRRLPLLGRVDRPAGPRRGARAQRADPGRPRPRRGAVAAAGGAAAGVRPEPPGDACRRSCLPGGVLNHASIAAFNEVWFRAAPRRRVGQVIVASPRSSIRSTSSATGTACTAGAGSLQYQFVVPFGAEEALRTVVERLAESGTASFLAVLKRFGAANPAPLSFPTPGWTLALDLPARRRRPAPGCSPSSTSSCSTPAAATTWPRTAPPRPTRSAAATPAWPSGRRSATASTRTVAGRATRAADCLTARRRRVVMENALGEAQTIVLLGGTQRHRPGDRRPSGQPGHPRPSCSRPATPTTVVDDLRAVGRPGLADRRRRLRRRRHRPPRRPRRRPRRPPRRPRRRRVAFGQLGDQATAGRRPGRRGRARRTSTSPAPSACARRWRGSSGARATAASSCCRASPASGCARPTTSTDRRRPASTASPRASATPSPAPGRRCSSCGPGSCTPR